MTPFTEADADVVLRAFDGFADVRARPTVSDLAVLVSLDVALQAHGLTITHLPDPEPPAPDPDGGYTPERLERLRIWADRRDPDYPTTRHAHARDLRCPWCAGDHYAAAGLLDEIARLRAINVELAEAAGMDPKGGHELRVARAIADARATPPDDTRRPVMWDPGTPVWVVDLPGIWRVATTPADRPDNIMVRGSGVSSDTTVAVLPRDLTYEPTASLIPGERVHRVAGDNPEDHGTVTRIEAGAEAGADQIFVKWNGRALNESGPYPPRYLERPPDLTARLTVGQDVTLPAGGEGRIMEIAGAAVLVATAPSHRVGTWLHVSDITSRG